MSLNPTTWNWKTLAGWIITALVVIALGPKLIDFAIGLLNSLKGLLS